MIIQTITWEDSTIETEILNEVLLTEKNPEILMLATSCDTALTLLTDSRIGNITCVSILSRNLAVLELKMRLLNKVENYQDRINFLEGLLPSEESIEIYNSFKDKLTCKDFWDFRIDIITNGIHLYDKWLKLFHQLKKNNYDFKKTFSFKKMIEIIGKPAIDNCLSVPYWKYFENVFQKHENDKLIKKENLPNIFYYQMRNFQYPEDENLPIYIKNKLSDETLNKMKLINKDLVKYLYDTDRKYSIISLGSFVIDRYNNGEIHTLFQLLKLRTLYNGRIIIRLFNNDHKLRDIINEYFIILEIDRNLIDKTYMYKDVIIAKPRR